ncbi:MAG TPA: hypothetical protein GX691_06495 [Clostridia bacterium]|nr:hypothetical protein [Clostridia bacterium]
MEKIATDLGLVPFALSNEFGKARCSYVFQIIELLRNGEFEGEDFSGLVRLFGDLLEFTPEEELDVLGEKKDSVRIMNLHKAKGLEAPVVFLANPCKNVQWPPDQHVKRVGEKVPGLYLLFTRKKYEWVTEVLGQPLNWDRYAREEKSYCDAEEKRLLYVAATRAKNMLIISDNLKDEGNKKNAWARLLEEIPFHSVLEYDYLPEPERKDDSFSSLEEDFTTAKSNLRNWIEPASVPGYHIVSPSDVERETAFRVAGSTGGQAWGSVIHRVFEKVVRGVDDLNTEIMIALEENGLEKGLLAEVSKTVEELRNSELWKRIEKAETVITEVPVAASAVSEDIKDAFGIEGGKVIVSGIVDLMFREPDGWVIVDYKTDALENSADFIREYGFQVKTYCEMVEHILGEKVKEGCLYSTYKREMIKVW